MLQIGRKMRLMLQISQRSSFFRTCLNLRKREENDWAIKLRLLLFLKGDVDQVDWKPKLEKICGICAHMTQCYAGT